MLGNGPEGKSEGRKGGRVEGLVGGRGIQTAAQSPSEHDPEIPSPDSELGDMAGNNQRA